MKRQTKIKNQLKVCKDWSQKARDTNEHLYISNMGLLYQQVALEQVVELIELITELKTK